MTRIKEITELLKSKGMNTTGIKIITADEEIIIPHKEPIKKNKRIDGMTCKECHKITDEEPIKKNKRIDSMTCKEHYKIVEEEREIERLKKVSNYAYYDSDEAGEDEAYYDMTPPEYSKYLDHVKEKNERWMREHGW